MADQDRAGPTYSLRPIDRKDFGLDHARHLLWRAGFGGTPSQVRLIADWGPQKAVDHLLDFQGPAEETDETRAFDPSIMQPPSAEQRAVIQNARRKQNEDELARIRLERQRREQSDRGQIAHVRRWWLKRMVETARPLQEKLTLFWHGHFATSYRTIENSWHMFRQNQLFREHAAGNFGDLLRAIIRDPAMIAYLDNNDSRKEKPNENLARELMELFSLGVGNYSEDDIKEGARALTGYSFQYNDFKFYKDRHDTNNKHLLGASGNFDGDDFVRLILARPACSKFIATKLYRFFVSELPPKGTPEFRAVEGVIAGLAAELTGAKYEIKPVLRKLLQSDHFYDSSVRLARIKSPTELVIGAVRSLNTPVRDLGVVADAMDLMGQSLFFPPSVKGWDGERSWINTSTLFVRQNMLTYLVTGKTPTGYDPLAADDEYDPMPLIEGMTRDEAGSPTSPRDVARYLLRYVLGETAPTPRLNIITDFLTSSGAIDAQSLRGALALITAMPEYQLC
ncbi:MAG TPA: DUF1800 domain-containing protein [Phycisphaerales bacterium]|nr:DUF1800 domain-containing protein [Phycisphaerales bacterium]